MEGGRWRVLAPARVILVQTRAPPRHLTLQSRLPLHDQADPLHPAEHVSEGGRQSETDGTRGREGGRERHL